jgi:pimeloyl-ACP methyl ester carboxylesterase
MLGQTNFCADQMGLKNWKQYQFFLKEIISLNSPSFIRAKTLVIWGSQDAFLLPPKIDEYRAEFGDVEFLILKGDHWVHLEQVNEVIHFIKTKFGGNYGALKACGEKILQVG